VRVLMMWLHTIEETMARVNILKQDFPDQITAMPMLWLINVVVALIYILALMFYCGLYMESRRLLYCFSILMAILLVVTLAYTGYTFYMRHAFMALIDELLRGYSEGKDADQYYSRMFWDILQIDVLIHFFRIYHPVKKVTFHGCPYIYLYSRSYIYS
jgi:hypothetical protein